MNQEQRSSFKRAAFLFVTLVMLSMGAPTHAQPERGGPPGGPGGPGGPFPGMDPARRKAVWTLQGKSVAQANQLAADVTEKLVATYKASRAKLGEAVTAALRGEGEDRQARREQMRKLTTAEREAFAKELGTILEAAQAEKVAPVLGSFSFTWDFATNTLSEIVKNEETLLKAVAVAGEHIAKSEAAGAASGGESPEARRERRQKMSEELNAELAKVLSEEEMNKYKEAAGRFRGRGPR